MNEAKPVTVGLSQEVLDINFGMQLVRMSRISGIVSNPDGTPVTSGNVNLMADAGGARGNQIGMNFGGRIQWDGAFTINNVPPGRYILRARGDDSETPQFAAQPISVNGDDLSGRHRHPLGRRDDQRHGVVSAGRIAGARLHAVPDHGAVDRPVGLRPAVERARRQGRTLHDRAASRPART